jgi:hypothetical protein
MTTSRQAQIASIDGRSLRDPWSGGCLDLKILNKNGHHASNEVERVIQEPSFSEEVARFIQFFFG